MSLGPSRPAGRALTCGSSLAAAYAATQLNASINGVQKQIGPKKKAKEDVTDLLKQKGSPSAHSMFGRTRGLMWF